MSSEESQPQSVGFGNWKLGLVLLFVGGFFASVASGRWSHGFGLSIVALMVIAIVQRKAWLAALRPKK